MKTPTWKHLPASLKTPIRIDRVGKLTRVLIQKGMLDDVIYAKRLRKLKALAEHLGRKWPTNLEECVDLTVAICAAYEVVPGFRLTEKGRGKKRQWTSWKYAELAVDVGLTRLKKRKLTEYGACGYIAAYPGEYDNRYPTKQSTVYRQYMIATKPKRPTEPSSLEEFRDREETSQRVYQKIAILESALREEWGPAVAKTARAKLARRIS